MNTKAPRRPWIDGQDGLRESAQSPAAAPNEPNDVAAAAPQRAR
jgi:hypothetical protein